MDTVSNSLTGACAVKEEGLLPIQVHLHDALVKLEELERRFICQFPGWCYSDITHLLESVVRLWSDVDQLRLNLAVDEQEIQREVQMITLEEQWVQLMTK